MKELLSAAGRAFLRAFGASVIVYAAGVLAAPNLDRAYALGVAALVASLAAGLRALQAYVPQLTLTHYLGVPFGPWADSFLHGFLGSLLVTWIAILGAPDLSLSRSVAVAAVVGALAAGIRALQGALTAGEAPGRHGLKAPPNA